MSRHYFVLGRYSDYDCDGNSYVCDSAEEAVRLFEEEMQELWLGDHPDNDDEPMPEIYIEAVLSSDTHISWEVLS